MDDRRPEQVETIFLDALQVDPRARDEYLKKRCGGNVELRAKVDSMLARHASAGDLETQPAAPPSKIQFAPGDVVAGRFKITAFIASGGMGDVYAAEDLELGEPIALKTIRPDIAADAKVIEQFKREIHLSRKVTHINVCRVFDIARHRTEDGRDVTFLTMELLKGETLAELLLRKGRLTVDEARPIVFQMITALGAAHEAGIIHRDFKSANVMLVPNAGGSVRAVVTDFGLARSRAAPPGSLSGAGAILGTPAYMAPEQVEGKAVTPAADIYSFGIVLYEMLTGVRPFRGDDAWQVARQRLTRKPDAPRTHAPSIDKRWNDAILRCLEIAPEDRFAVMDDVRQYLEGERVPARRRTKVRLVTACGLIAVAATATSVMYRYSPNSPQERQSVAVFSFRNSTSRSDTAWIGFHLAEGLRSQLTGNDRLRTISGQEVAEMKRDLAIPDYDTLSKTTLTRLHNAGADLVVVGSYTDIGSPAHIHVNAYVQDAAAGETLYSVSADGTEAELPQVLSTIGRQLRAKFGLAELSPERERQLRLAQPSAEAAPDYARGLENLRSYEAQDARYSFEHAIAADPSYAFAHSALAETWSILGFDDRAREEARKAFVLSAGLSLEDRLVIEGRYRAMLSEWPAAINCYSQLYKYYPDSLEYGLKLAEIQRLAGNTNDALSVLSELRRLRRGGEDPRIDLEEAENGAASGNLAAALEAARRASGKAKSRGSRLLETRSLIWTCSALRHLGRADEARTQCEHARQIAAALGDPLGGARALTGLGNISNEQGDLSTALRMFKAAFELASSAGARRDISGSLNNLGTIFAARGQLDDAKTSYERSLSIQREIGFRSEIPRTLSNLGEVLHQQGKIDDAQRLFTEALQVARETGSKQLIALALANTGSILFERGDLAGAERVYTESLSIRTNLGAKREAAAAVAYLGDVLLARGDLNGAAKRYREALNIQDGLRDAWGGALTRIGLARVLLERRQAAAALETARAALQAFTAEQDLPGQALANATIARGLLCQGNVASAVDAINSAEKLLNRVSDLSVRFSVLTTAADVIAAAGQPTALARARSRYEEVAAQAQAAGMPGPELEARLQLSKLELAGGRTAAGRRHLHEIERRANQAGYGLIAKYARFSAVASQ